MSDGCHGHGHAHGSDGMAAGVAAAADTEVDHLKAAIANLRLVQDRRNEAFFLFERGFQEYLKGVTDFVGYRSLCHEITLEFIELSADMGRVRDSLAKLGRDDLIELVGRIQALEKRRLELVAESQVARCPPQPTTDAAGAAVPSPEGGGAEAVPTKSASDAATAATAAAVPSAASVGKPAVTSCADEAEDGASECGPVITDGGGRSDEIRREFMAVCQQLADCLHELKYEEIDDEDEEGDVADSV